MDFLDRAEEQQASRKRAGEPVNDRTGVSQALTEPANPRVFLSWLTKEGCQVELNIHVHLRIRRWLGLAGEGLTTTAMKSAR
jgi:hypothetical protein